MIRSLAELLRRWTGCSAVGVRLREGDDFPYYELSGFPEGFGQVEKGLCRKPSLVMRPEVEDDTRLLPCLCGNILGGRHEAPQSHMTARGSFWSNGNTSFAAGLEAAERAAWTCERCSLKGFESAAYIPLRHAGETMGLLQLSDAAPGRFTTELMDFLEGIAGQIAVALAQRSAEAALLKSERRFQEVSAASGHIVWETDAVGRLSYVSENVEQLFGLPGPATSRGALRSTPNAPCMSTPSIPRS